MLNPNKKVNVRKESEISEYSFTHKINLFDTIILGIGSTIGATIFSLIAPATRIAGPAVILAFIINFVIALFIAANYAECASRNPINGGGFSFVEDAFGEKALFLGWLIWLGNTSFAALTAMVIGEYLTDLILINKYIISVSFLSLFTIINAVGSKRVSTVQKPLAIALVLSLVISAIYLFASPLDGTLIPFFPNGILSFLPATALLFVGFVGFEGVATISAEIENPRKNIPRALILTVIIVGIIYIAVVLAIFFSTSTARIVGTDAALLEAVKSNIVIRYIVDAGSVFALLTSLSVALMAASRNIYALSRDDFLPRRWSLINAKYETPTNALLLTFIIALIILFSGQIAFIASISNISYMLIVSAVGLAVIKFRRTDSIERKRAFRIPFYPYSSLICIIFPFMLIFFLPPASIFLAIAWFLIGIVIYIFFSSQRRIFGTIYLIATFLFSLTSLLLGIIVIVIGLIIYLVSIADRHAIIIAIAGIKFAVVVILALTIWILKNTGIIASTLPSGTILFNFFFLRIMIFLIIITLITTFLDVVPIREIVHYFIKKIKKEKVTISIGEAQIVELEKSKTTVMFYLNLIIGSIEILGAIFVFVFLFLIELQFFTIVQLKIGLAFLDATGSKYIIISIMLVFASALLASGVLMLYYNWESRKLKL